MNDDGTKSLSKVIRIDESEIRGRLGGLVRGTVEETLNGLLDALADEANAASVMAKPRTMTLTAAADQAENEIHEPLSFYTYPSQHWLKLVVVTDPFSTRL